MTEVMLDPTQSESLFEPGPRGFHPDQIGNAVECKACAQAVPSTEPALRRHAERERPRRGSYGGSCGDFWRRTHQAVSDA